MCVAAGWIERVVGSFADTHSLQVAHCYKGHPVVYTLCLPQPLLLPIVLLLLRAVAAAICAVAAAVCAVAVPVCAVLSKSDGSMGHEVSVMFSFPPDTCVMYLAYMCQGMRYLGTPSAGPLIGCG
jgi:hypothetical protein